MKYFYKHVATAIFAFLALAGIRAQTVVTIPSGNTSTTVASTTAHRKPLGEQRAYERTALKYTHAEIGMMGTITNVGFYCDTVNNPGKTAVKIYLKEIADSTFAAASTVATEETGATLVYSDTIYPASFVKNNWVTVALTTTFVHATTNNIEVIVETNNTGGTAGTDATALSKGFREYTVASSRMQYWQSTTGSGTPPATNGTLVTGTRCNIQFTITPLAPCTSPPTAGTTVSTNTAACSGSTINLSLNGNSIGAGQTYQWISSPNGTTWSAIGGATNPVYTATVSAVTYYACVLTCSAQNDTSSHLMITINPFYNCYCTAGIGGGCTAATQIDSVSITGTTLINGPLTCPTNNYIAYPASGSTTASLTQGNTYSLVTKFGGSTITSVWIDYNHDGAFTGSAEWKQVCTTSTAGVNVLTGITIPFTSTPGLTGMRIRTRGGSTNDSTSACTSFASGETQDYVINIIAASPCTSPPTAGTTVATPTSVCTGGTVNLSLNGNSTGSGQTYQWVSSSNGTNWTAVPGATNSVYSTTVSAVTYFKCVLTCSGQSDSSTAVQIAINPFYNCYCTTGLGGNCATTAIDSVSINGTPLQNGLTGCSAGNYTAYPASGNTTATLNQGQTYTFDMKFTGNVKTSVWFDYNQNGNFETSEWSQICTTATAGSNVTASITVPMSALTGMTGMRVRSRSNAGQNDSTSACANFGTGETEDYVITIGAFTPCSAPPTAGTTIATPTAVCSGGVVNLSLSGTSTGAGLTYQWLSSANGTTWTPIVGATLPTATATVTAVTYFACEVTCSSQADTSSHLQISLNPFYQCYCTNIGGGCTTTAVDSVAISATTLDNGPTGCSAGNYTMYPASGNTTATLLVGTTYTLNTVFTGSVIASVWIDYDQSGTFDTTEWVQICTTCGPMTNNATILNVPVNAQLGMTGMRVRSRSTGAVNDSTSACTTFGSGETEDYLLTLSNGTTAIKSTNVSQLYVFPNPSNGVINIGLSLQASSGIKYTVTNLSGETVYAEQSGLQSGTFTKTIDLSGRAKGVYFVKVFTDKEVLLKKVILQ
jgi:hypothetical protein